MEKVHVLHHSEIANKVKSSTNPLRNRRGVTVTELMVVLGMIGIVALGNATFLFDFTKQLKKITESADSESGLSTLTIASVNILKKSAVSFNKLYLPDDYNGGQPRNFFDYFPDVPFSILQTVGTDYEKRTFTIERGAKDRYFYLLQSEESDFDSLIYDPMFAFKVSLNAPNQLQSGQVSYAGLNSIANVTGTGGVPKNGTMTQFFQSRWATGELFLLSCPTYLRNVTAGVNILSPPRFPSYLGKVNGNDLSAPLAAEVKVGFYNSNPLNSAPYSSTENFLRNLPSVGGAAPFVKVEPVKMVRFEVRLNNKNQKYDLWFQELIRGEYKDKFLLLEDVKTVKFIRKSISLPIISMEVEREVPIK